MIADSRRADHRGWVDRSFVPFLAATSDPHLRAERIALTDVYTWKLLRHPLGLDQAATAAALTGMVGAVIRERRRLSVRRSAAPSRAI